MSRNSSVRALAVVLTLVATLALVVTADPSQCHGSCKYTYSSGDCKTGITYTFDLEPLCGVQLTGADNKGHTYTTSICANSKAPCLPSTWRNTYEYGVSVQFWGGTPKCNTTAPECHTHTNEPACCTADCQVLGTGEPKFKLKDPENPYTGGITVTYLGAAASDSDPFWCTFNPATGAQYEREVTHDFTCAPEVETVKLLSVKQNVTNDCHYTIYFASSHACAQLSSPELGRLVVADEGGPVVAPSSTPASPLTPGAIVGMLVACVVVGLAAGVVAFRVMRRRRAASRMGVELLSSA